MNNKEKTNSIEKEKKKRKNLIYNIVAYSLALLGVVLLILAQTIAIDILFFISLGVLGLGIMLIVQKSVYTQTKAPDITDKEEKSDEKLELRKRQ